MEKNITRVTWSAQNLPAGLSFDTSTGTFTGQLDTEGEYIVPVKVETNYGSDEKDVKIVVEGGSYPVYAIGKYAATWSGNATPNEQGFKKLPMPRAKKLVTLTEAFGAKISSGKWYVCGNVAKFYGIAGSVGNISITQPIELPIEDVADIAGGEAKTHAYFVYRTLADKMRFVTRRNSSGNYIYQTSPEYEGAKMLQKNYGEGIILQKADGSLFTGGTSVMSYITTGHTPDKPVKTLLKQGPEAGAYLTNDGELYFFSGGVNSEGEQLGAELGTIREVWGFVQPNLLYTIPNLFAQSARDGKLYAMGSNTSDRLGLPEATTYTEFTEVGDYQVKKIDQNFMLTMDGKLYHAGNAITNITGKHTGGYAQIFPELKFKDISYNSSSQTLVVLLDEE